MSLARYPLHRDSGIKALGGVPAHWRLLRLKHVADVRPSNVDKKSYEGEQPVRLCNYTDVYYNDTITSDDGLMAATASEEQIARFGLRAGDVIITKDSETADDIAISAHVPADLPGVVCGYHLALLRPRAGMVGGFLKRLFDAAYVKAAVEVQSNGLTRVGLSQYALNNLEIVVPPEQEQQEIVRFLNEETEKLDALISKQQRLIFLLREKQRTEIFRAVTLGIRENVATRRTDLPWAPEIPLHWVVYQTKHVTRFTTGWTPPTSDSSAFSGENLWANISDLGARTLCDTAKRISDEAALASGCEISPAGSLLFSFKLSVGQVSFAGRDMYTNEAIATFFESGALTLRFAFFALPVMLVQNASVNIYGAHLLNQELMRSAPLVLPPHEEQIEIAEHLERTTTTIGRLIDDSERAIALLQERRAALISAAVTGQIDVRTYRPAEEFVPA